MRAWPIAISSAPTIMIAFGLLLVYANEKNAAGLDAMLALAGGPAAFIIGALVIVASGPLVFRAYARPATASMVGLSIVAAVILPVSCFLLSKDSQYLDVISVIALSGAAFAQMQAIALTRLAGLTSFFRPRLGRLLAFALALVPLALAIAAAAFELEGSQWLILAFPGLALTNVGIVRISRNRDASDDAHFLIAAATNSILISYAAAWLVTVASSVERMGLGVGGDLTFPKAHGPPTELLHIFVATLATLAVAAAAAMPVLLGKQSRVAFLGARRGRSPMLLLFLLGVFALVRGLT